ncbi:hypothetical protein DWZ56_20225 [Lachnotalea sp. AF33-28]|nr:hypothetical protein DWZ56_20225 [Lachnotalea sp. AF33-28]
MYSQKRRQQRPEKGNRQSGFSGIAVSPHRYIQEVNNSNASSMMSDMLDIRLVYDGRIMNQAIYQIQVLVGCLTALFVFHDRPVKGSVTIASRP